MIDMVEEKVNEMETKKQRFREKQVSPAKYFDTGRTFAHLIERT